MKLLSSRVKHCHSEPFDFAQGKLHEESAFIRKSRFLGLRPRNDRFFALIFLFALFFGAQGSTAASEKSAEYYVLISDTHLGFQKSNDAFAAFLQEVTHLPFPVKAVINNGDIAEIGSPSMFKLYQDSIHATGIPGWNVIGNHDTRWNPLGKNEYLSEIGPLYCSKDVSGIHWMFLDSTIEHQTQGHVSFRELQWIKQDLSRVPHDEPILVFSHHPLKWAGISIDDGLKALELFNGRRVVAFVNGHGHCLEKRMFHDIPFLENDALFHGNYLILKKEGDEIQFLEKRIGKPELTPWDSFSLSPKPFRYFPAPPERAQAPESVKKFPLGEIYAGLTTNGKLVYASTLGGMLFAVDGSGKVKWKKWLNGDVLASPFLWRNVLYVGTKKGTLYAFRASNGKFLWKWNSHFPLASPPLASFGKIYLVSGDKTLYALAAKTGEILWKTVLGNFTEAQAAATEDKVFVGAWDNVFYALRAADGRILWKKKIGKAIYYSPAEVTPVLTGNLVLVPAKDHFLHAFDQDTGEEKWRAQVNDSFTNPILVNGELVVPEMNGNVASLDPAGGKILRREKFPTSFYNASPVLAGDKLIFLGVNGHLFFYNLSSKKIEENFILTDGFCFSAPVVAGGFLWAGSLDGFLYKVPLP